MVRVVKLIDDNNLKQKDKEYDFAEVIINLDNSNISDCSDLDRISIQLLVKTPIKVRPIAIP